MLISSFTLAMAFYPGRAPRKNRRLSIHRRMVKCLRKWMGRFV